MKDKQIEERILLEAKLRHQCAPQPKSNPFVKRKKKLAKIKAGTTQEVGTVHVSSKEILK
jgi:hypothetical protein